jgi:hypothetical protein
MLLLRHYNVCAIGLKYNSAETGTEMRRSDPTSLFAGATSSARLRAAGICLLGIVASFVVAASSWLAPAPAQPAPILAPYFEPHTAPVPLQVEASQHPRCDAFAAACTISAFATQSRSAFPLSERRIFVEDATHLLGSASESTRLTLPRIARAVSSPGPRSQNRSPVTPSNRQRAP